MFINCKEHKKLQLLQKRMLLKIWHFLLDLFHRWFHHWFLRYLCLANIQNYRRSRKNLSILQMYQANIWFALYHSRFFHYKLTKGWLFRNTCLFQHNLKLWCILAHRHLLTLLVKEVRLSDNFSFLLTKISPSLTNFSEF